MCFSMEASFAATAVMSGVGVLSLNKASGQEKFLAALPFLFAVQQLGEGILWTQFETPGTLLYYVGMYLFLAFAFVIWPTWFSLSVYLLEKDDVRKKWLFWGLMMSCLWSLGAFYFFLTKQVTPLIECGRIVYLIDVTPWANLYYLSTLWVPFYLTTTPRLWLLSTLGILSYIVTWLFFTKALISVWCFFAAILSGVVYYVVGQNENK